MNSETDEGRKRMVTFKVRQEVREEHFLEKVKVKSKLNHKKHSFKRETGKEKIQG